MRNLRIIKAQNGLVLKTGKDIDIQLKGQIFCCNTP